MTRTTRPERPTVEDALEEWLRTEAVARYDAYKRSPQGEAAEEVFARLREHHAKPEKRSGR